MGTIHVLPNDEIEDLLRTAIVGRIACCGHGPSGDNGRPFLVPLAYGYDGEHIYAHSGPGRKIRLMRAQPLVSFEVDTAEAPDRWRSVIADAVYEELTEPEARERALAIIYPVPTTRPDLGADTIVYRLRLTAKSGRYEVPN
ncbi:MAG: pyridoxamine 5'-phosphate oxidase family protein [Chloroflexota bacterium]|nr:pyridoxamine 5'-phosphate oxidase family protein [Chloroflexota bacterium]